MPDLLLWGDELAFVRLLLVFLLVGGIARKRLLNWLLRLRPRGHHEYSDQPQELVDILLLVAELLGAHGRQGSPQLVLQFLEATQV